MMGSSPLDTGAWNLEPGFCFHVRKLLSIFGQIPSSRFQVPRFKARQHTKVVFSRRPQSYGTVGTWNLELGFCRLSGQVPDPRWPKTADSKLPGPTSRRAPKNKASSTRPFSEGKFHASRSFRGQVPSSGTVMAQRGVRFFLSATAQELAVKILNPHFPRLGPSGTSHYRVRFRSSGGASSSWMSGMSIIVRGSTVRRRRSYRLRLTKQYRSTHMQTRPSHI